MFSEKSRELGIAQGEIKALRATEVLNDKAVEEVRTETNMCTSNNTLGLYICVCQCVVFLGKMNK